MKAQMFLLMFFLVMAVSGRRVGLESGSTSLQDRESQGNPRSPGEEDDVVELLTGRFLPQGMQDESGVPQPHEDSPSHHSHSSGSGGCSGGCSGARGARRARPQPDMVDESHPRPIYGLLTNIIDTARLGYRLDSPRAHLLY